ncbi:MAG TPA: DUF2911 domain-containing protein [Lacibacter sp.]|nr:DUF2911 domain-containing protein [Lacibacter sp.]HMO89902.1 DUF2911 domain-containing protein [Lacibacter sp.]HMP85991.1 DUF2911 domain-containing protein [Lacibacter sp.]
MKKYTLLLPVVLLIHITCTEKPENANKQHKHEASSKQFTAYIDSINRGLIEKDTLKGSPSRLTMANIGPVHVHIEYQSPGVKDRIIWGGLVPYNEIWVTGAHTATRININGAIFFQGKKIEAGTYALFTIPGEKEWIFIINKNYKQHLADEYSAADDVFRMTVTPQENNLVQRLTWQVVPDNKNRGKLIMQWEKIKIEVPFSVEEIK